MFDKIGDRFKENYENRTRYSLPRRTYTIIRVDGKAFHTFTKKCERPFDKDLMEIMDATAISMCESIQGVKMAYVQSDEISLLLTDFEDQNTCAWFDGNIQKMASIAASIATANFNLKLSEALQRDDSLSKKFKSKNGAAHLALFDARVFTIPEAIEVENYFIWRQADAVRNSIQMAAQALYSHKELHGKNGGDLQEMIFQKGINWDKYPSRCKRGSVIAKEFYDKDGAVRSRWIPMETPQFTKIRHLLRALIPLAESWKKE